MRVFSYLSCISASLEHMIALFTRVFQVSSRNPATMSTKARALMLLAMLVASLALAAAQQRERALYYISESGSLFNGLQRLILSWPASPRVSVSLTAVQHHFPM